MSVSRLRDLLFELDTNKKKVPPEELLQAMACAFVLQKVHYWDVEAGSWINTTVSKYLSKKCPDWKKILTRLVIEEDEKLTERPRGYPISENNSYWNFLVLEDVKNLVHTDEPFSSKVADLVYRHKNWQLERYDCSHQPALKIDLTLPLKNRYKLYLQGGLAYERSFAKYFGPRLSEQEGNALLDLIAAEPEAKRMHLKQLFSVSKRPWWKSFSKRILF